MSTKRELQLNLFPVYKSAKFSECRKYRYSLRRTWDREKGFCLFICLNPSTADETTDDPTIRRCIDFAKRGGYGGICMVNLFALRATHPRDMLNHANPIGSDNDKHITELSGKAGGIVVAWGAHGSHMYRDKEVLSILTNYTVHCLKTTKGGHPGHPLYIPANTKPKIFRERV